MRERDLMKKILATGWLDHELSCEVEELLAQKRKPLSEQFISVANQSSLEVTRLAFRQGVRFAEKAHGIGGGDE